MFGRWWRRLFRSQLPSVDEAREQFLSERDELETLFFRAAASSGKPRGLRWKRLEWQPETEFVREKDSGRLAVLVGVTIAFEAIEGSDMEDLPAVSQLRHGSAVFFYHDGNWHTLGRTLFNLPPADAVVHFASLYERI